MRKIIVSLALAGIMSVDANAQTKMFPFTSDFEVPMSLVGDAGNIISENRDGSLSLLGGDAAIFQGARHWGVLCIAEAATQDQAYRRAAMGAGMALNTILVTLAFAPEKVVLRHGMVLRLVTPGDYVSMIFPQSQAVVDGEIHPLAQGRGYAAIVKLVFPRTSIDVIRSQTVPMR